LDDAEDVDAVSLSKHDSSERFPLALVEQIASGGNPIKCFREYRKLSQTALALRVNISRQYMSQIESGDRQGTTQLMKKIASVLGVDLDDLVS
jgi:DNA-binding XRE family transcriptional regulator